MTMFGTTPIYCPEQLLDVNPEPGWQDDGLYIVQDVERHEGRTLYLDNIKVRTKKGEFRVEPVGGVVRYSREKSNDVWKVRFLAGEARS